MFHLPQSQKVKIKSQLINTNHGNDTKIGKLYENKMAPNIAQKKDGVFTS